MANYFVPAMTTPYGQTSFLNLDVNNTSNCSLETLHSISIKDLDSLEISYVMKGDSSTGSSATSDLIGSHDF